MNQGRQLRSKWGLAEMTPLLTWACKNGCDAGSLICQHRTCFHASKPKHSSLLEREL